MKLKRKQKEFLFENYYVNAKVLDACVESGWKDYFMDCFDWLLSSTPNKYELIPLRLVEKESGMVFYTLGLNFQDNDYEKLMSL